MTASCSAYHTGLLVLPTRRVADPPAGSTRPSDLGNRSCTRWCWASMITSASYSHPTARCSSSIATGSRSGGGVTVPSIVSTERTRSIR